MRLIQQSKHNPNTLEVVWMWLPTFIGENKQVLGELDHALSAHFPPPVTLSEEVLDAMHEFVIEYLCSKFTIVGLEEYLTAVKFIDQGAHDMHQTIFASLKRALSPSLDWDAVERGEKVTDTKAGITIQRLVPAKGEAK